MHTSVTDEGLALLARLRSLESLDLAYTPVTDAGLASVAELPNLRELTLNVIRPEVSKISDAGMIHLAKLSNLENLRIFGTAVSDEGVRLLAALGRLKHLGLVGSAAGGEGLAALRSLPIESLYLSEHQARASLASLKAMPKLKELTLNINSGFNAEAQYADIEAALPGCAVGYIDP